MGRVPNRSRDPCRSPTAHPLGRVAIALAEAPEFVVTVKLKAGEMLGFDNRRMLQGRGALDRSTGDRWLRGCYVEREELESTLRVLARSSV